MNESSSTGRATVSDAEAGDLPGNRFAGLVAIVPGSSADPSIGRACAERLAREGAAVVINGRDRARLGTAEEAFRARGLEVTAVAGSMEDTSLASRLVEAATSEYGRVDLLVNTIGGVIYRGSFERMAERDLLDTVRLNTWPAVALMQEALEHGLAEGGGAVVNVSSGSPRKTTPSMVAYAAAKACLNALTRTMAADLAPRGVRVNAVSPGLTRTTATRDVWGDDEGRAAGAHLPTGRLTTAEDIAAAVAFLLSGEARQITGVALDVDGGNHLTAGGWSPFR